MKAYTLGTHRVRTPSETLAAVTPLLDRIGITRVANITGLDRVGIPVWQAIRPNGRTLAVSQGKGLDAASAKVSAIMESIEVWHAESVSLPVRVESYEALLRTGAALDPARLPRLGGHRVEPHRILSWVEGDDLLAGGRVWVPFELVHQMFLVPEPPGSGCFFRSSNGLASGNTRAEALVHALSEVIERDGFARSRALARPALERRRLDPATVSDGAAAELLARFEKAGIAVALHDLTTPLRVPIFSALIFDRSSDDLVNPVPAALGGGCHPDAGVALCRALTEAAQSRLAFISGARDDLDRATFHRAQARETLAAARRLIDEAGPGSARFGDVAGCATPTVEGDLAALLGRLRRARIRQAAAIDLSRGEMPVKVVRVVVPGLTISHADRRGTAR
jgi:ribosomal protein S12 methylthiotransferase accessory factor